MDGFSKCDDSFARKSNSKVVFEFNVARFSSSTSISSTSLPTNSRRCCNPKPMPGTATLGRHRLLCGDAIDPADLARLLGETPVDLLLTDPQYNVGYEGKTDAWLTIANDGMSGTDYRWFLVASLTVAKPHTCGRERGFYLWHADTEGQNVRGGATKWVRSCSTCSSDRNPLDLVQRELVVPALVKFGGQGPTRGSPSSFELAREPSNHVRCRTNISR